MRNQIEVSLETDRGKIAGIHWPVAAGPRVLCLHGWLDNAASFAPIAEHATELDMVALDFPGHGKSSHHHPNARYHFADYLSDVHAALEALQWQQCHLLGHSLGAGVSSLFAAGLPQAVVSLTMLDCLGPWAGRNDAAGARLRRSMANLSKPKRALKPYPSIADMVTARQSQAVISAQAATLLCRRGAQMVGDHYQWRSDPRLHWVSPVVLSEEQALDCLALIEAPMLSVLATLLSKRWSGAEAARRREIMHGCQVEEVAGNHHVHMDEAAAVAAHVVRFIMQHHTGDRI